MTPLETDRLLLRPWRDEDGIELQRLFGDPAVAGSRNLTPERIAKLAAAGVRQWRANGFGPWAALDKATGAWIGKVGLDELEEWPDANRIEVGFELHRAWWGRGLATEAALEALRFGFDEHGLQRIISVTAAANPAARRVMEKAGLTYQGTRHWLSATIPVAWYAIDRTDWQARRDPKLQAASIARLQHFFGTCFHEDWDADGTWERAIDRFCATHDRSDCLLLADDLAALSLQEPAPPKQGEAMWWTWLYREFQCHFNPDWIGLSEKQWLIAVSARLKHLSNRRDSL